MSTDEKPKEQFADELQQAVENAAEENAEAAGEASESSPSADLEALQAKVQEFQEQVLRSQAEMQNVRRRAENDVEKSHKFAVEKFVKELLPVVDSL